MGIKTIASRSRRLDQSGLKIGSKWALTLFLVLLIYDGAIRKWLLLDFEQIVFVAKDALLLAAFSFYFMDRKPSPPAEFLPAGRMLFACYVVWVALETFNPNLPNLLVGMWGLKAHLLYASLIVLVPLAFQRLDEVFRVLEKVYAWAVIPVVSIAFLQLAAPADNPINQHVRGGIEGIAYFGSASLVRVTGTFSYISGMAAFVQVTVLLGIALLLCGARSKLFLVGLAFALMALPVTGSRGVVVVVMAGASVLLLAAVASRAITIKHGFLAAGVLALLTLISLNTQDAAWEAFVQRVEFREDRNRAITAFTNAFDYFESAGITGFGTGSANLGAPSLAKDAAAFSWLPFGSGFEEESGRVVIELGVVGWLISLAMRAAFLYWAVSLALRGATVSIRAASVLALPIVALGLHQGNGVFAVPLAASYYWFCIAILAMAQYENRPALVKRLAPHSIGSSKAAPLLSAEIKSPAEGS